MECLVAEDDPEWNWLYGIYNRQPIQSGIASLYWQKTKYHRDPDALRAALKEAGVWEPMPGNFMSPLVAGAEEYEEIMAAQRACDGVI